MSNREDYLDGLLRSVTNRGDDYTADILETEDDFLEKFDQDVADIDDTSFLNDFELELDDADLQNGFELDDGEFDSTEFDSADFNDMDMDNLMVDTMSEDTFDDVEEKEPISELDAGDAQLEDLDAMLAAAMESDGPAEESGIDIDTMSDDDFSMLGSESTNGSSDLSMDKMEGGITIEEDDKDILDILTDMSDDDDLADIGNMLKAHENDEDILPDEDDISLESLVDKKELLKEKEEADGKKKKGGKKEKKPKKEKGDKDSQEGFLKRISLLLFGEDDEDIEVPESKEMKNISEENLEVLKDLEKEKKKKEKKEKQEEKKKLKQEKQEQKKKENLEKKALKDQQKKDKPVEVDNTPPLPKVPVILIFLMGFSIILLVMLGSNLVGYSTTVSDAKSKMSAGNYIDAYEALSGIDVKEVDQELYERTRLTAILQRSQYGYEVYISQDMYPEALDSLISGIGRYNKYYDEAEAAGAGDDYNSMRKYLKKQLKNQFGVSEKKALKIYKISDKEEYTKEINSIISSLGL